MKIPEALIRSVKRDSRYDDFIQDMHKEHQKAALSYLRGENIIAEVENSKYICAIVYDYGNDKAVEVIVNKKLPQYPVASGRFMDQWEPDHRKFFGVNNKQWNKLSFSERAEIELALQLKLWVRKEFYKHFASLYFPEEYDKWWWDEGGKEFARDKSMEAGNKYWKKRLNLEHLEYTKHNPVGKLTRAQKDALVNILKEKPVDFNSNPELFYELLGAKYIQPDKWGDTYELTELGKEIAASELKLKEQAKAKTRSASRARYGAMSGLGLKKTRYGGWE